MNTEYLARIFTSCVRKLRRRSSHRRGRPRGKSSMSAKIFLVALTVLAFPRLSPGADSRLDFWEDLRLFGSAVREQEIDRDLDKRGSPGFKVQNPQADRVDFQEGDFSYLYKPSSPGAPERFGFSAGLHGETWTLSPEAQSLRLLLKTEGAAPQRWQTTLVDAKGRTAGGLLSDADTSGQWTELVLPLADLTVEEDFQWNSVRLLRFESDFGTDCTIRLDGVRFQGSDSEVAVTDKPLAQRMAEAEANREARVESAFRRAARNDPQKVVRAFALMYLNEDLEEANLILRQELEKKASGDNPWGLLENPIFCRFYFFFSNRVGKFPGRVDPATERILLETLWNATAVKNDIHWARQSTWWLDGSENHDLNAKACNLVTSRIFMNEPDYKDRIYPNHGFGGAYRYFGWDRGYFYGSGIDPAERHGGGRANLSDGKSYTAKDHYQAWVAFLKEYFQERARRGFFLEHGSPTYTKHTLNFVDLVHQYGGDEELKKIASDFLDLVWTDWAQTSIAGVRGGPKTRHHQTVIAPPETLISFHLGGIANAGTWWYWNLLNDYQLPPMVWKMALARQGMGSFTYRARGVGEEENIWPRPPGTERTLLTDTDSRFLKYTYVTPDYTLGTQMDHPAAVHSHLSFCGRWHGMTFAQDGDASIAPVAVNTEAKQGYDTEITLRSVQHERTLILQQMRSWLAVHPDWFPGIGNDSPVGNRYGRDLAIWIGKNHDRVQEQEGWIFVQNGAAYAAVRIVQWDEDAWRSADGPRQAAEQKRDLRYAPEADIPVPLLEASYRWNDDRTMVELVSPFSPVIFETGRAADYPTLERFISAVLANPVALYKTVIPGLNVLVYTGAGDDQPEIVFNASTSEIPTVAGQHVDYSYPKTFDSPYLQSDYKSGIIRAQYGEEALKLDFSTKRQAKN